MRDRLLVRLFIWRFVEHDLVSPNSDRHVVLSAVGGALGALSLFAAVMVAKTYQFANNMPPGITSLLSLDDRFLFVASSMLVMALAAVLQWDALVLDPRDAAVLGPLPLKRGAIVRAKFVATGLFAAAVLVAWNLFPTLLRAVALPIGLRIPSSGALKLTAAHALVVGSAGLFGFLAVLGLRETAFAILGGRGFRRISPIMQAALIVALATSLLVLPGVNGVAGRWRAREDAAAKALPPSWFVGLHETIAGAVVDDLPRVQPPRYLLRGRPNPVVQREREATELYRSLWPLYGRLARIAAIAFAVIVVVTTAACLWNSRRLPSAPGGSRPKDSAMRRASRWFAVHVVVRAPLQQAGFFFTLQTLWRHTTHRVAMASTWAMGLALVVVAATGSRAVTAGEPIPVAVLAVQPLLIGTVLHGFRRAARLPAELRASNTFRLAWSGEAAAYVSGVKRAGWLAVAAPALVGLGIWNVVILGPRLAALRLVVGAVTSAVLIETMFLKCRAVPFVRADTPAMDVKLRLIGLLVALVSLSSALGRIERLCLERPTAYVSLVASGLVISLAAAAFARMSRNLPMALGDENEIPGTQPLDLVR